MSRFRGVAIVATMFIPSADQKAHDRLDAEVGARIMELGGPPEGLMAHVGFPYDGGLMTVDTFRTEELYEAFLERVLGPALSAAGLSPTKRHIGPAWSFARP